MGIGDVLLKESFSVPFKHRSISEYRFSEIRLHVEFHFRPLTLQKHSYCEKFCQSTPIDFWSNILSVKSRNWTCLQTSEGGMDSFGLVCSSLATIKPQQTVGSPKVNFADNRTKNYTCTHTNSEHRRSVIRADADLLDEASKSRSYGASLFSIYQLQDKSEVQIKLGMSPALKYRFYQFWLAFSISVWYFLT